MNHWILQLNPTYFCDEEKPISFYKKDEYDWWGISRYFKQTKGGDEAYIWQSIDKRVRPHKPRGIYAKARIISGPPHSQQSQTRIDESKRSDVGEWTNHDVEQHQKSKPSLLIQYISDCYDPPLTVDNLMMAGLHNIGPLRFFHTEIYKLDEQDALRIEALLRGKTKP